MAVVVMLGNTRHLVSVRHAINARAASVRAGERTRRHAVVEAVQSVAKGACSTGWAVSEACRQLAGKPTMVLHRGGNGPEAA
jgi:predicted fused transcriptional regulator/phosphomethylpyrimidine kinase